MDQIDGAWDLTEFTHPDDGLDFYIKLLVHPLSMKRMVVLEPIDFGVSWQLRVFDATTPQEQILQVIDTLLRENAR